MGDTRPHPRAFARAIHPLAAEADSSSQNRPRPETSAAERGEGAEMTGQPYDPDYSKRERFSRWLCRHLHRGITRPVCGEYICLRCQRRFPVLWQMPIAGPKVGGRLDF